MRVAIVVNRSGGTAAPAGRALADELRGACERVQIEAAIRLVGPEALAEAFEDAANDPGFDAVIAGGGDGTVGLAAAAAVRHDRTLGILPLGTLNHLARDAGIPADLAGAVAVIARGAARRIDVAEVNGHLFVNNSGVGLYPVMVRSRQAQQRAFGRSKRIAMLVASLRALRHFGRHRLTIRVEGNAQLIQTPLLFVGNNIYETSLLTLGRRAALDRGELCLYAMLARTRRRLIGLALRGLVGTLDQQRDFISLTGVSEAEIDARLPALTVAADGETLRLDTPLKYRIHPRALRLLMPAPEQQEAPAG
jgi:diacylglycerol kinase family enzyme